jgi:hypothetical protein
LPLVQSNELFFDTGLHLHALIVSFLRLPTRAARRWR